tara:strand:- start:776 stop:1084 length:309 start_codon:yes stop_codon:yes gene_type:complete
MKFKVSWSAGRGTGKNEGIEDFKNEEEAVEYAFERACEEYERYPNRGIRDIMDEEEVDKEEAEEIWYDERGQMINYSAVPVKDKVEEKTKTLKKEVKKKKKQ